MSFTYKEYEEYLKKMQKAAEGGPAFIERFMQKTALQLLHDIRLITPVDTGAMRNSWEVSKVYRIGKDKIGFYLFNKMEYSSFVNDGHTTPNREGWVEGYYMVEVSTAEIERKLPKRFNAEFKAYLKKLEVL